ncbi:MAG: hypothetical protein HFI33_02745 [Lachnospiraceae bacterium]|nr:hypothetical protein [Lachnospiraceae bacterium]
MNEQLFNIVLLMVPVIGTIITGILIPYIKTKISATQMDEIIRWITKAVQAAEILFDAPKSGAEKQDYVINFIDEMFNSKKEIITKAQIRILLESACNEMNKT